MIDFNFCLSFRQKEKQLWVNRALRVMDISYFLSFYKQELLVQINNDLVLQVIKSIVTTGRSPGAIFMK